MDLKEIAKGKRVLVTDGFCKQVLPFLRSYREMGCEVTVLCDSKLNCAYVSRLPHHKILAKDCDFRHCVGTESLLDTLVKSGNYDMISTPSFDGTLKIVARNKAEWSKYLHICVNDKDVFEHAYDKNEVMRVCMTNKIPCPITLFEVGNIEDVINGQIAFPVIIKPRRMFGARGFHILRTKEEFKQYIKEKGIDISEYVIQEFIPEGSKVAGANIFIDKQGEIKSSYLYVCEHLYPEDGGTSTLNAIMINEKIKEDCEKLVKIMNLRGLVGVDFMVDSRDGVGKILEINVRPVHGITIGFECGVNHAQQLIEDEFCDQVSTLKISKTDTCVRIGQTDALWFLSSPNRFKRTPRKLGYKHVKEQMFFWDDPMPWFAFLLSGVKDYRKTMLEKRQ